MESKEGEIEEKILQVIKHPGHNHSLVLSESLQGHDDYGGGYVQVKCDGCREPISSSSSSSYFYACLSAHCWFLLHKRCAELPPQIEHPSHPENALTLSPFPLYGRTCNVCHSDSDGFLYRCSDCEFHVHVRCASMALHIKDRVHENNKIHQHPLIPLETKAQFLCHACGREHEGKSYLCSTCGFWANQTCASAPTTISLRSHPHPHPLGLLHRPYPHTPRLYYCEICKQEINRAYWAYRCSERCNYFVHVGCSQLEVENSNKDIQPASHRTEIRFRDPKTNITLITWQVPDEFVDPAKLMTQWIKNLGKQAKYERALKILYCEKDHPLIFVDKKINESKDDQQCKGCTTTISSEFYQCRQCNFSLHSWCAELPNKLEHPIHPGHFLLPQHKNLRFCDTWCDRCGSHSNGIFFGCVTCAFSIDLKCAALPQSIKHRSHDHNLVSTWVTKEVSCNGCEEDYSPSIFQCEACNFRLCIRCVLLPYSIRHRYDKHSFVITYSPTQAQPYEYFCETCERDINSMYWFYHCIECDQSLHTKCIYPIY